MIKNSELIQQLAVGPYYYDYVLEAANNESLNGRVSKAFALNARGHWFKQSP